MQTLQNIDFTGQKVLVRTDFNVAVDADGIPEDFYKLEAAVETVQHILSYEGARVALLSHRGRPGGTKDARYTMSVLRDDIERLLGVPVGFVCEAHGVCVHDAIDGIDTRVILLENVRFYPGEKADDTSFASELAAPFDCYVNEAFAVSHRAHASLHAITRYLPSYAGLWLQREVETLARIKGDVSAPSVAIIGGAKIETKLPLITLFSDVYDAVLVGGRTAVEAQEQGMTFPDNVFLPEDYTGGTLDIGPVTVERFVQAIASAATIVWNGPLGKFEEAPYDHGTRAIAEAIAANTEAFSVVGGGESVQALGDTGHFDDVSFVSTGGGAMLAFLLGEDMPALDALAAIGSK